MEGLQEAVARAMRRHAALTDIKARIAAHGFVVQGVFPPVGSVHPEPPFAYTIGMTPAGLPELAISGLPAREAHVVLSLAVKLHLAQEFTVGSEVVLKELNRPLLARDGSRLCVGIGEEIYGEGALRVVQLVWASDDGEYPDDNGWDNQWLYHSRPE